MKKLIIIILSLFLLCNYIENHTNYSIKKMFPKITIQSVNMDRQSQVAQFHYTTDGDSPKTVTFHLPHMDFSKQ